MNSKNIKKFRLIVQLSILILVTTLGVLHQIKGGGPTGSPNIHTVCPFGGLESIYKLAKEGKFVTKIFESNVVLLIASVLLVFFVGRFFCGWICSLGALQDLFAKLGKAVFKRRFYVPVQLDKYLGWLKYIVLGLTIFLTWKTGTLIIASFDPFASWGHLSAGISELFGDYLWGTILLIALLVSSLFINRAFCRYLCPMGAFLAIFNKISFFTISRDELKCTNCTKCRTNCHANIPVDELVVVKDSECTSCLECVGVCPTNASAMSAKIGSKKINIFVMMLIGLLIWFGTIAVSRAIGYWNQTPQSVAKIVDSNTENIFGWMTFEQITSNFMIAPEVFYKELGVSQEEYPLNTTMKSFNKTMEAKEVEGFYHDKVRDTVKKLVEVQKSK